MSWWWSQQKDYVTFKSVLKFGSTVHICIGVIFWYFLITLLDTIIHRATNSNMSAPLMGVQYFIYLFLFLPLGVLLYRGVKKESVPILQWSAIGFLLLQTYGGLTQYQYGFVLSSFIAVTFPSLSFNSEIKVEIGIGLIITLVYLIIVCLYVRELRSRFYIPPVYPCRVDYFYYPEDTSANITVFHKQVPCQIMNNYQNSAYFVQKEFKDSPSFSASGRRSERRGQQKKGSGSGLVIPNGRIPIRNCKPW